jgi:hypothetical protein
MPKLIDYPRTTYSGAWELAEVVDDTGGKCAIETAARKLNRKVSGSFKAIIGSAVKFGLVTSKRDLLSTTTLFRRIKHAYDKQEELVFHREAFLTPPLFTQLCRKFRSRELPVQMLDVMLIREFGVEEINALGVARAFIEGARMVGLLNEHNTIADIDQLAAQQPPRRELASPQPVLNTFRSEPESTVASFDATSQPTEPTATPSSTGDVQQTMPTRLPLPAASIPLTPNQDAVANLFGLAADDAFPPQAPSSRSSNTAQQPAQTPLTTTQATATGKHPEPDTSVPATNSMAATSKGYQIQIKGPGIDTQLTVADEDDLLLMQALLEKIRRQLRG